MRTYISRPSLAIAALAAALSVVVGGCGLAASGPSGIAGTLDRLKPLAAKCDRPLNAYVGIDLSLSAQGDAALLSDRVEAVSSLLDQAAACGGYAKVVAFSGSVAETFPLGDAEMPTESGTETARLIQADKAADSLMEEIEVGLPEAQRQLNANGSDILAQLNLAQQYQAQRSAGALYLGLVTDGIATEPVAMNTPDFTEGVARSAARRVPVPDFARATVRIAGIGKTSGQRQLSTERIAAITAFYEIACKRTGAQCLVTTDYTPGG